MPKPDDFFDSRNTIRNQDSLESDILSNYLEPIKAFSRTTYASVYVIDYAEKAFEYVSDNPLFLCGNTADQVLEMGYEFYFKHVPKEDLQLLLKINDIGFARYEHFPIDERKLYTISYDFHLQNPDGKNVLINQKLTPIFLNSEGKVWKALCIVSLSSNKNAGNIRLFKKGSDEILEYDLDKNYWKSLDQIELKDREKEILQLSIKGYTIKEIANQIFVSADTVKFHRKNIFEKLGVSNITEAIAFAINNKII